MSDIVSDYKSFLYCLVNFRYKVEYMNKYLTLLKDNNSIPNLNEEMIPDIHDKLFNKYHLDVNQYFFYGKTIAMFCTYMYPYISKYIDYSNENYFLNGTMIN